jgi:hypothetical protein
MLVLHKMSLHVEIRNYILHTLFTDWSSVKSLREGTASELTYYNFKLGHFYLGKTEFKMGPNVSAAPSVMPVYNQR